MMVNAVIITRQAQAVSGHFTSYTEAAAWALRMADGDRDGRFNDESPAFFHNARYGQFETATIGDLRATGPTDASLTLAAGGGAE